MASGDYYQLKLVYQLCPFFDKELATVTNTLVTARLDYCNALYVGPRLNAWKLQLIHNTIAQMLIGTNWFPHATPHSHVRRLPDIFCAHSRCWPIEPHLVRDQGT